MPSAKIIPFPAKPKARKERSAKTGTKAKRIGVKAKRKASAMMAIVKVLLFDKGLCFLDDRDGIMFVRAIRSGRFSNDILTVQGLRERNVEIFV
jgi:hypothetical protein